MDVTNRWKPSRVHALTFILLLVSSPLVIGQLRSESEPSPCFFVESGPSFERALQAINAEVFIAEITGIMRPQEDYYEAFARRSITATAIYSGPLHRERTNDGYDECRVYDWVQEEGLFFLDQPEYVVTVERPSFILFHFDHEPTTRFVITEERLRILERTYGAPRPSEDPGSSTLVVLAGVGFAAIVVGSFIYYRRERTGIPRPQLVND